MTTPLPILRFDSVSKHFGGLSVIDDLTFVVRRGSRTGLIGPNGAGKTTAFNLITGVYPGASITMPLTSPICPPGGASATASRAASRTCD